MRKSSNSNPKKIFDLTPYPDVQEYLEKQSNMTQYVVELIRKDMNNTIAMTKESMFAVIEEYLSTKGIASNEIKSDETEATNDMDNEKLKNAALKIMGKV